MNITKAEYEIAAEAADRWPKGLYGQYLGYTDDGHGVEKLSAVEPGHG